VITITNSHFLSLLIASSLLSKGADLIRNKEVVLISSVRYNASMNTIYSSFILTNGDL